MMTIEAQLKWFAGCRLDPNGFHVWASGQRLSKGQFNVLFGGYIFLLDCNNEKTTKSAHVAFVNLIQRGRLPQKC